MEQHLGTSLDFVYIISIISSFAIKRQRKTQRALPARAADASYMPLLVVLYNLRSTSSRLSPVVSLSSGSSTNALPLPLTSPGKNRNGPRGSAHVRVSGLCLTCSNGGRDSLDLYRPSSMHQQSDLVFSIAFSAPCTTDLES